MGLFNAINTSASGLSAERTRMDVISKNIANANTTKTSSGMPYRRQMVSFQEKKTAFSSVLSSTLKEDNNNSSGVEINKIIEDKSPFKKIYEPGHPDANEEGYVYMPNVDVVKEMVDMITATRSYEANITAMNATKSMAMRALEIGR